MAGSFTPDCLSREGSPIPEVSMETEVSQNSAQTCILQQGQLQQHVHPTITDLRFSQSAPGSPSGLLADSSIVNFDG